MPPSAGPDHSGHGWNAIWIGSEGGVPLLHRLVKLNESEKTAAVALLAQFAALIRALMPEEPGVITADGGFNSPGVREAARAAGLIENIHGASHGDQPSTHRQVKKLDEMRIEIQGYPDYYANGHRELFCRCGQAHFSRQTWRDRKGRAQVRTEGDCVNCGHISITAGNWRLAKLQDVQAAEPGWRYVRIVGEEIGDLQFGNPLTYYDEMAADYGNARRGRGEGPHGHTLTQRFEHLKGKRWFRRMIDAELDTNVVFSIMLSLALEDMNYRAELPTSAAPPPTLLPSSAPPPALPLAV